MGNEAMVLIRTTWASHKVLYSSIHYELNSRSSVLFALLLDSVAAHSACAGGVLPCRAILCVLCVVRRVLLPFTIRGLPRLHVSWMTGERSSSKPVLTALPTPCPALLSLEVRRPAPASSDPDTPLSTSRPVPSPAADVSAPAGARWRRLVDPFGAAVLVLRSPRAALVGSVQVWAVCDLCATGRCGLAVTPGQHASAAMITRNHPGLTTDFSFSRRSHQRCLLAARSDWQQVHRAAAPRNVVVTQGGRARTQKGAQSTQQVG